MERMTPGMLAYIIGLALLVMAVQTLWAWRAQLLEGVKRFLPTRQAPRAAYVTPRPAYDEGHNGLPGWGNAEEEDQAEAEDAREAPPGISAADINRLLEDARERAAARALGTLIGANIVPEGGRSRAMEALFGPAGRRHTRVRPWVVEAEGAARAARPEADEPEEAPRIIGVNVGGQNERKILL